MGRDSGGSLETEIETEKISLRKTWTGGAGEINTEITSISFISRKIQHNYFSLTQLKLCREGGLINGMAN